MTEDTPMIESASAPVIDQEAAERAKRDADNDAYLAKSAAEHEKRLAELNHRRKEEREIAAAQDLALKSIRERCDAERAAFARSLVEAPDA